MAVGKGLDFCVRCTPRSDVCTSCLDGFPVKDGHCINSHLFAMQTYHVTARGVLLDSRVGEFVGVDSALQTALQSDGLTVQVGSEKGENCLMMRVVSGSFNVGDQALFYEGDQVAFNGSLPGLNVMVVQLGVSVAGARVKFTKGYDFYNQASQASQDLVYDLDNLQVGDVVLGAVRGSGLENLDTAAIRALNSVGSTIKTAGGFRKAYAFIGSKGRPTPHTELLGGDKVEVSSLLCSGASVKVALAAADETDAALQRAVQRLHDEDTSILANRITKAQGGLAPPGISVLALDSERSGLCPGLVDWVNKSCAVAPTTTSGPGKADDGGLRWWHVVLIVLGVALVAGLLAMAVRNRSTGRQALLG